MHNWILIIAGILVLTAVFIAARPILDRPLHDEASINISGDDAAPTGGVGSSPQPQQSWELQRVPSIEDGRQNMPPADGRPETESAGSDRDRAGSASLGIGPSGQIRSDPGIPPEGLSSAIPQSQNDLAGPRAVFHRDSSADTPNQGELTDPSSAVDILGVPASASPDQAPEASDTGKIGPAPESSDPGVSGPAPEDS